MKNFEKTLNALQPVSKRSLVASFLIVLTSLIVSNVVAAENERTKVVASITIPSQESVWNAAERLGMEMKFRETVQGVRELVKTYFPSVASIDPDRQLGVVVATNENEVFPFVFLPLVEDALDENAVVDLKAKIQEKIKLENVECIVKDATLFIAESKFKELIPTNVESYKIEFPSDKNDLILNVNVNVEAVPQELVDAGFALLRQKIAEQASNEEKLSASNLNLLLEQYSSIIESLSSFAIHLFVDEQSNCVIETSVVFKSGSDIVRQLQESNEVKTRWSAFLDSENVIISSVNAGKQLDGAKEYQLDQFVNVACGNILDQLDALIDDPEDFEFAKQIVELLTSEEIARLESGVYDSGLVVQAEPPLVKIGTSVSKPEDVKKIFALIVDRIKKDVTDVDKYVSLEAEAVEGFSVSKVDIPVNAVVSEPADYFQKKTIAARIGIDDRSLVLVAGLSSKDVDSEFVKLLRDARELKTVPQKEIFDFAPLAKIVNEIASSFNELQPAAKQTLERIAEAQDVKIVAEQEMVDNQVNLKFVLQNGIFRTIGDVIRVNLRGGSEDDSEDMDDVFDEE